MRDYLTGLRGFCAQFTDHLPATRKPMTADRALTATSYTVSAGTAGTSAIAQAAPIATAAPVVTQTMILGLPLADLGVIAGIVGMVATYLTTLYYKARRDRREQEESELRKLALRDRAQFEVERNHDQA